MVRLKTANQYNKPYNGVPDNIMILLKKINKLATESEEACNNKIDLEVIGKSLKLLAQPQLFRQTYFTKPGISEACNIFLKYIQATKELISELTSMNINTFIDHLTYNSKDDSERLFIFMNFLNENSLKQNNEIETLFNPSEKEFGKMYTSKEDVILNFESIESICNPNKPLILVMYRLVLEFSKRTEVKDVIQKISNNFVGNITRPGDYNNIYITSTLAYKLDESNAILHDAKKNQLIPPNSKITTNATYKPINLESIRTKTDKEKQKEKEIISDLNNFLSELDIRDELIPKMAKLTLGKGRKKTKKKALMSHEIHSVNKVAVRAQQFPHKKQISRRKINPKKNNRR